MSQEVNIIGKVKQVNRGVGNANYEKTEVIVTTDEQYPQHILIEFGGQKASMPDHLQVGQQVNISVNLRGREWVNPEGVIKYFNSIQGWKISMVQPAHNVAPAPVQQQQPELPKNTAVSNDDDDDLPF